MKSRYEIAITLLIVFAVVGLAAGASPDPSGAAPPVEESAPGTRVILLAGEGTAPFYVPPPLHTMLHPDSATFTVNYLAAGTVNYWGDTCQTWPADAQTAFTYAANIWGGLLNSSVPIVVNACWSSLDPGVLGSAGARSSYRDFTGAPQANTWYAVALANALSGTDRNGATSEIEAEFTSSGINWYFGTDGHPGMSQYDFASVVLHEIGHGLGFSGSMYVSGGQGSWGGGSGYPYIYDRFAQDNAGVSLLNTGTYANPSAALASALQSQNIYFSGTNANAANGNARVKLYAPATWQQGSSYAHLDVIFDGTPNALMTYSLNNGESVHSPGPVTLGIFKDTGWTTAAAGTPTATPPPTSTPTRTSTPTPTRTPSPTPTGPTATPAAKIFLPLVLRNYPVAPTATTTGTPTRTATPTITPTPSGCTTLVNTTFEGDFPGPWTVFDNDGAANGTYYWAARTCQPFAGSYSGWGVGGGADGGALGCGSSYPNNASSWMVYGPFSLVGATSADLTFKLWLNSELTYDTLCRLASINGANFSGTCTSGNPAGWSDRTLNLANVAGNNYLGQANVWIALVFSSNSATNMPEGGYVDNVVLRKCTGVSLTDDAPLSPDDQATDTPATMELLR